MILDSEKNGKSNVQPSVSPSGRFVIFIPIDYGMMPVYQPGADLYIMDTHTGLARKMSSNSEQTDFQARWSSNGRWILFCSKRRDMIYTRLYIAYVDENGDSHPALELPQEDTQAEESQLLIYTMPSLLTQPVEVERKTIKQAIVDENEITVPILP